MSIIEDISEWAGLKLFLFHVYTTIYGLLLFQSISARPSLIDQLAPSIVTGQQLSVRDRSVTPLNLTRFQLPSSEVCI